jgi:hypothetical protein
VASIVVAAPLSSIAVSASEQITATAKDGSGNTISGVSFTWTSSAPNVAAINSGTGSATGLPPGTTQITASANGVTSAPVPLNVTPGFLDIVTLNSARSLTTITILNNGLALVAAGINSAGILNSAELYNPATATFSFTGSLNAPRYDHTATLLNNGKVLIAGGRNSDGVLRSAELYDPAAGTFAMTGNLITPRLYHTATHLQNGMTLIAGGSNGTGTIWASAELYDPVTGVFAPTGSLNVARRFATATLLNDGKVLIAGGFDSTGAALASAEIFDPETGAFTLTGSLNAPRGAHTATLLNGGMVLIAGGSPSGTMGNVPISSAELYNPATGTFGPTGSLIAARTFSSATLLNNGTVLVAGGDGPGSPNLVPLTGAEVYDPAAGNFTATGSLVAAHRSPASTLLPNGFVLFAGNFDLPVKAPAELYEPATFTPPGLQSIAVSPATSTVSPGSYQPYIATGTFASGTQQLQSVTWSSSDVSTARISNDASNPGTSVAVDSPGSTTPVTITATAGNISDSTTLRVRPTGFVSTSSMNTPRAVSTATLLNNGLVLVADGEGVLGAPPTAELYDPATGSFEFTGTPIAERDLDYTATLLENGKVLIAGGFTNGAALASAEIYDPRTATFAPTGAMNVARYSHTATLLRSGNVLVTGGLASGSSPLASAELYDPNSGVFSLVASLNIARGEATASALGDGTVLIAGGETPGAFNTTFPASAELYDPGAGTFAVVGSLSVPRASHTATLLQTGMVLIAGGAGSSGAVAAAELYDPFARTFTVTANLNGPRYSHTATLLNGGKVLIAGGTIASGNPLFVGQSTSELYDPETKAFTTTSALITPRQSHAAVLLDSGMVLLAGGADTRNNTFPVKSAELY